MDKLLASQVIKANNRVTAALENGGGGEQWETVWEDENGATSGNFSKAIIPTKPLRLTVFAQGFINNVSDELIVDSKAVVVVIVGNGRRYDLMYNDTTSNGVLTNGGYFEFYENNWEFIGNPVITKPIFKIEVLK